MSNKSESIAALAEALSKAQGEIEGAKKGEVNPAFAKGGKGGKYANLAAVWDAIRVPFSKNGLSVTQNTRITEGGHVVLVTTLMHSSGEWSSGDYPISPVMDTPQALGSAVTYGRRFSLMAIAGVAPIDDDGEEASRNEQGGKGRTQPREPQLPSRDKIVAEIMDAAEKAGMSKTDLSSYVQSHYGKPSKDLTPRELGELLDFLKATP